MFYTQTDNAFGICQLGKWDSFDHTHIESVSKEIIDISKSIFEWLAVLKEIRNVFIVSQFIDEEDINSALDFVKLCRNNFAFITVITPATNSMRKEILELKNCVDVFLYLDKEYYEDEKIDDPVSYAIDFLAESFDEEVDVFDFAPWYDGPFYAFSQSGSAKLVVFKLLKSDYNKEDEFQLPTEVVQQVAGKRLAFLHIKSGDDNRLWPKNAITNALKKASGKMIYASWRSTGSQSIEKKTWVTAIVSDMDNPNNSFGSGKDKTFFQGGKR